ncbi:nucleotide sugar dehydrogenase, partial [Prochlorococcus sp. AH-716-O13]|nr:nucleotide sugar dehydrogenase [Prochlorococcus sp. AH-716-O13]
MAVIAKNCPHLDIEVVDTNQERVNSWNSDDLSKLPVFEPGLSEIIDLVRGKNLFFSTNVHDSIQKADMIFISVNTPIKKKGIGAGETSDLRWVESCARQISEIAKEYTIIVEKSTLPVRTAQTIKDILLSKDFTNKRFSVLSNPEFLSEGTAIRDLEQPDRVLIGGDDIDAMNSLKNIYLNWVPEKKLIFTNLWSSELSKLTANAFLAQRISSINSISAICEATGADVREVSDAIGKDSRIGSKFLKSGPGFGGSCFKKDILNLVYISKYYGLHEVADYWRNVVEINSWQQKRIYEIIVRKLFGNLADKKIAILGFAFKENTNDTRESPSIEICKNLLNEGAFLSIHDVKVTSETIEKNLFDNNSNFLDNFELNKSKWEYQSNLNNAIKDSDALILLTEWEIYKNIYISRLNIFS